ncbi:hypothetical protein [Agromyces sp. PvR057]|uniref:hypothetical protein n=1 Tax=Agromyces sp. PvR057 TaxID=3156403 RepID=UPI003399D629
MGRLLRFLWSGGFFLALVPALIFIVVVPTDLGFKLVMVGGLAVVMTPVVVLAFRRTNGAIAPRVSFEQTVAQSTAELPLERILDDKDRVVGILTSGPFARCYLMVGHLDTGFWYAVVARGYPHTVRDAGDRLSLEQLKAKAENSRVRFLADGLYTDAVIEKYFA